MADKTFVALHKSLSQITTKQTQLFLDSVIEKYTCKSLNIEAPKVTLKDLYPEDEWTQATLKYLRKHVEDENTLPLSPLKLSRLNKLKQRKVKKQKLIEKKIKESELNRTSLSLNVSDINTDAEDDSLSVSQLLNPSCFSEWVSDENNESKPRMRTRSSRYNLRNNVTRISPPNSCRDRDFNRDTAVFNASDSGMNKRGSQQHSSQQHKQNKKKQRKGSENSMLNLRSKKKTSSEKLSGRNLRKKFVENVEFCDDEMPAKKKIGCASKCVRKNRMKFNQPGHFNKFTCRDDVHLTLECSMNALNEFSQTRKKALSSSLPNFRRTRSFSSPRQYNCKNIFSKRWSYPFLRSRMRCKPVFCDISQQFNVSGISSSRYDEKFSSNQNRCQVPRSPVIENARKDLEIRLSKSNDSCIGLNTRGVQPENCSAMELASPTSHTESVSVSCELPELPVSTTSASEKKGFVCKNSRKFDKRKNYNVDFPSAKDTLNDVQRSDTDEAYISGGSNSSIVTSAPCSFVNPLVNTHKASTVNQVECWVDHNYSCKMQNALKECLHVLKNPQFHAGEVRTVTGVKPKTSISGKSKTSTFVVLFEDCSHGVFDSLEECEAAVASHNLNFRDAIYFHFLSADCESDKNSTNWKKTNDSQPFILHPSQLSVIHEESDEMSDDLGGNGHIGNQPPECENVNPCKDPVHVEPSMPLTVPNNEMSPSDVNLDASFHALRAKKFDSSNCNEGRADCRHESNFHHEISWEDLVANAKPQSYLEELRLSDSDMKQIKKLVSKLSSSSGQYVFETSKTPERKVSSDTLATSTPVLDSNAQNSAAGTNSTFISDSLLQSKVSVSNCSVILPRLSPSMLNIKNVSNEIDPVSSHIKRKNESYSQSGEALNISSTWKHLRRDTSENSTDVIIEKMSQPIIYTKTKSLRSNRKKRNKSEGKPKVPETVAAPSEALSPQSNSVKFTDLDQECSSSPKQRVSSPKTTFRNEQKSPERSSSSKQKVLSLKTVGSELNLPSSLGKKINKTTSVTAVQHSAGKDMSFTSPLTDLTSSCSALDKHNTESHSNLAHEAPGLANKITHPVTVTRLKKLSAVRDQLSSAGSYCTPTSNIMTQETHVMDVEDGLDFPVVVDALVSPAHASKTNLNTKPSHEVFNSSKSDVSEQLSRDSRSSSRRRSSFSFVDSDDSCDEESEDWITRPTISCSEARTDLPLMSLCRKVAAKEHTSILSKRLIDSLLLEDW